MYYHTLFPSSVIGMKSVMLECTITHCLPSIVIGMNIVVLECTISAVSG